MAIFFGYTFQVIYETLLSMKKFFFEMLHFEGMNNKTVLFENDEIMIKNNYNTILITQ